MGDQAVSRKVVFEFFGGYSLSQTIRDAGGPTIYLKNWQIFLRSNSEEGNKAVSAVLEDGVGINCKQYCYFSFILISVGIKQGNLNNIGVLVPDCQ